MMRVLIFVALIIGAAAVISYERRMPCTIEVTPFRKDTGNTHFWAVPESDTVLAGPGPVEPTGEPGHWGWGQGDSPIFGQRFDVKDYGGAGAAVLDSVFETTSRADVVVVLWDYDAACEPTRWAGSAQWTVVGYPGFLSAELRDDSLWAGGRPTFDSFWAGQMVYPIAALKVWSDSALAHDTLPLPFSQAFPDALMPEEVFKLVEALPAICDWYHEPAAATRVLAHVKQQYPGMASRFPGTLILEEHERWATEAAEGKIDPFLLQVCAA